MSTEIQNKPEGAQETHKTTVKDLLKEISKDKKINGEDLAQIESLVTQFEGEKKDILAQTKLETTKILQESLKKGYTLQNENDYKVLVKILTLINKEYILPPYEELAGVAIKNKEQKGQFSVTYSSEKESLDLYVREGYMKDITVNTDLVGRVDLKGGKYMDAGFFDRTLNWDDDLRDNNEANLSNVDGGDDVEIEEKKEPKREQKNISSSNKKKKQPTSAPHGDPDAPKDTTRSKEKTKRPPFKAESFKPGLTAVSEELKKITGNEKITALQNLLGNYLNAMNNENARKLQQYLKDNFPGAKLGSKDGNPDGKVGSQTLKSLQEIAKDTKNSPQTQPKKSVETSPQVQPKTSSTPEKASIKGENISEKLNYSELKNALSNFNQNEKRFLLPEGTTYFGDNVAGEVWSGMALKKGRDDFRVMVSPDGTFMTLNTTGIDYQDISQKAKTIKTGTLAMKNNQFDFSQVL